MCEITEEFISERVVTQILDNRATVSIGVSLEQLIRCRVRESVQEKRLNAVFPRGVDNRFVGQNGVGRAIGVTGQVQEEPENKRREQ